MAAPIYVPRAFGGTLIIPASEIVLPASEINAQMLVRRGSATLNPRTGAARITTRRGSATLNPRTGAARITTRRGTITWTVRKD